MIQEFLASRECEVCREPLLIVHEKPRDDGDGRTVALNQKDGARHVCFDLPADANLMVLEDPE